MSVEHLVARFPDELRVGTQQTGSYVRVRDHVAVEGALPESLTDSRVGRLEAEDLTICSGDSELAAEGLLESLVSPVYQRSPGGSFAVPTGEIFVRLEKGARVEDHAAAFEDAGYVISRTLVYAPNAAWLRAGSGDLADALAGVGRLEALPGVENVEPQMLSPRALR